MTFEILLIATNLIIGGLLVGLVKILLDRQQTHIDERLDVVNGDSRKHSTRLQEIDREVMLLRVQLPEQYVRREDWIRFGAVIEAKLDRLNDKLDRNNAQA